MHHIKNKNVFFTSDTHLGHQKPFIWESRGYLSVQDHDNHIIHIINNVVQPDDILFHLGDFCLNTSIDVFEIYINQIKCQNIYLLHGNHNNPHYKNVYLPLVKSFLGEKYENDMEVYPIRYKNIFYVGYYIELKLNGKYIILSHFPFYSWNGMSFGSWMLHGHEHSKITEHLPEGSNGKILDVSWDYFKRPISYNEINDIMETKNIKNIGHH